MLPVSSDRAGSRQTRAMLASYDRTLAFLRPGRFAVDEELLSVERPQASAEDVRR